MTEEEKANKVEQFKAKKAVEKAERKAKKTAAAKAVKEQNKLEKSDASVEENNDEGTEREVSDATGVSETSKGSAPKKSKARNVVHSKVPLEQGKKSNDSIFITNLAFEVKLKTLQTLFKEYNPVWIHVPTRKLPPRVVEKHKLEGKPARNKGIAFVKFTDETLQMKAIEEFNGMEIGGRKIVVDVAIDARAPLDIAGEEKTETKEEVKEEAKVDTKAEN